MLKFLGILDSFHIEPDHFCVLIIDQEFNIIFNKQTCTVAAGDQVRKAHILNLGHVQTDLAGLGNNCYAS